MSLKEVKSKLLDQIGFSEEEQEVYFAIQGIGSASLGEISLQTQIPLEELLPIMQELVTRGYLKKVEGKINRYIALEPFLKGFLFVEKEFQNDMIGIENSLINCFEGSYEGLDRRVEEFKEKVPPIFDEITEELRNANEKLKMDLSDALYRHADKVSKLEGDFDQILEEGFEKIHNALANEFNHLEGTIGVILREETERANERAEKFEELTNKTIQEMTGILDKAVDEYEATVPEEVKDILKENKEEISSLQKKVKETTKEHLDKLKKALKDYEKQFFQILSDASKGYKEVIKNYKEGTHTIFEEGEEKVSKSVEQLTSTIGKNVDSLSEEALELKENIDEISQIGRLRKPSPELVEEILNRADKINSLSQEIKDTYEEVLTAYQEDLIKGFEELIEASDKQLTNQLKEGTKQLKELKTKLSSNWTATAKDYDKALRNEVKDVLKEAHPRISNTAELALDTVINHLKNLKETHTKELLPLREVVLSDVQDLLENLFIDSSKKLRLYSETNERNLQTINDIHKEEKFQFLNKIQQTLSRPKIITSEMIGEYTSHLDSHLTDLEKKQNAILEILDEVTAEFLKEAKDGLTSSSNEISNRIAALLYKVNETKNYLQEITDAIDEVVPVPRPHSLIVYGDTNVINAIHDILLRTKSTCTIVAPTIDDTLFELLKKRISVRVRVRILADLDSFEDEALITALKEQGNITLWQYTGRDFYAVTRDGAEVLLAPLTQDGELTAFLTEQEALVRAIQQIINASFMARAREL